MGVIEPARISLSSDIKNVGIINRSIPSEGNTTIDKIDKILSLEGINLDREGAEATVTGLADELERHGRFETIHIITDIDSQRKGLGVFPAALNWTKIEEICKEKGVDVLFSLEFYDTDTRVDYELTTVNIPNNLGIIAKVPGHKVTLNTVIINGWRVYDPATKQIVDECIGNDRITSRGEGINPVKAIEAIIGRNEAVMQVSSILGNDYGRSTQPVRLRISRDYFVKGNDNFKIATRRARAGDWEGAASLWEREVTNSKAKIAGRACYNMAIINEINGDLETAMNWASTSYTDYNNRNALNYINLLKRRIAEKRELDRQLSSLDFNSY